MRRIRPGRPRRRTSSPAATGSLDEPAHRGVAGAVVEPRRGRRLGGRPSRQYLVGTVERAAAPGRHRASMSWNSSGLGLHGVVATPVVVGGCDGGSCAIGVRLGRRGARNSSVRVQIRPPGRRCRWVWWQWIFAGSLPAPRPDQGSWCRHASCACPGWSPVPGDARARPGRRCGHATVQRPVWARRQLREGLLRPSPATTSGSRTPRRTGGRPSPSTRRRVGRPGSAATPTGTAPGSRATTTSPSV